MAHVTNLSKKNTGFCPILNTLQNEFVMWLRYVLEAGGPSGAVTHNFRWSRLNLGGPRKK